MNVKKALLPLALAASMTGVAACGGDDEGTASGGGGTTSEATATPTPAAAIEQLTGNTTSVKLDAGFVEALTQLEVTPGPVGDAKITNAGSAVFPITGGNVQYYGPDSGVSPYVQGQIMHEGSGLSLTAGGTEVELTDFVVDPGTSTLTGTVSVDGQEAAPAGTPLFFLDGRTLENPPTMDEQAGTVTLTGTTVKLKQEAADLLNDTFGIQDLEGGLVIGVASIEAKLPAS